MFFALAYPAYTAVRAYSVVLKFCCILKESGIKKTLIPKLDPISKVDHTPNELESLEWDPDITGDSTVQPSLHQGVGFPSFYAPAW